MSNNTFLTHPFYNNPLGVFVGYEVSEFPVVQLKNKNYSMLINQQPRPHQLFQFVTIHINILQSCCVCQRVQNQGYGPVIKMTLLRLQLRSSWFL